MEGRERRKSKWGVTLSAVEFGKRHRGTAPSRVTTRSAGSTTEPSAFLAHYSNRLAFFASS